MPGGSKFKMISHMCTVPGMFASWFRSKMHLKMDAAKRSRLRTHCSYCIASILVCILAGFGVVAAQQPSKQSSAPDTRFVLRQTVRRVRVDVVVTDGQGRPVKGLAASDFRVTEDGKPQSIRQFEWHGEDFTPNALPRRPPLPPRTFMNLPSAPERGPLTVLLYDVLNTPLDAQSSARRQVLAFLKENSGRRIAVFLLGDHLRILQGFTQDTDSLVHAAANAGTIPRSSTYLFSDTSELDLLNALAADAASNSSGRAAPGASAAIRHAAEMEANAEAEYASFQLDRRVAITLDALAEIGHFLSGVPGRKNLLWFSGSFPGAIFPDPEKSPILSAPDSLLRDDAARNYIERMRKTTDLLNTAEVAVYPIDARGLQTNTAFSASGSARPGTAPNALKTSQSFFSSSASEFATMDDLSEQTGGRAFYNTNGLKEALEKAADDGNSYYSLVYAPSNAKFDGTLRRISVHLASGHHHLAYRRTYFSDNMDDPVHTEAPVDDAAAIADTMTGASDFGAPPAHELIFAAHLEPIGSPAPATAEQMDALGPYRKRAANITRRKITEPPAPPMMQSYAIMYAVASSQLDLPQSAGDRYQSDLSFAALAFDEDGETLWGTKTQLKDSIPASKLGGIRKDGFQAVQAITIPTTTAVIRLVVRDEHSGRTGSMEVSLPLPDKREAARSN